MSTSGIPNTFNNLSSFSFKFTLARAPNISWNIQSCNLPSISVPFIDIPTPFVNIPSVGGKIEYGYLKISFLVQENLSDYMEIHDWLSGIGRSTNFQQFKTLSDNKKLNPGSKDLLTSDITLTILKNTLLPNITINFYDAFPTEISDLNFNTTDSSTQYIEASTSFRYLRYDIQK